MINELRGKNRWFRCHQILSTTFSRKQKKVIPSNSIDNNLAKTTTTKLLCFHVMSSNSISKDLVETRKRSVFNCKRCHWSIDQTPLTTQAQDLSLFLNDAIKFYHQWPLESNKYKSICFSFYVILLYSNFKQQLTILRDQSPKQTTDKYHVP